MKSLAPVLCLLLSACGMIPGLSSGDSSSAGSTVPASTTTVTSSTATAGAAVATAAADPTVTNVANAANAVAGAASATGVLTGLSGTKSITFDSAKKLEYVDLYVDMGDPAGQRALVPYLMKPKDWMLVGCDMTSVTSKHYRFMRVSTADGRALPEVDIFKGR